MKKLAAIILSTVLFPVMANAQQCNDAISLSTPSAQFQVNNDEVRDYRTNLVWQRCSLGQSWTGSDCSGASDSVNWAQALSAGTGDWRLPNIKELLSIVEVSCASPSINESIFPDTAELFFWTSSPYVNNNQVWLVSFTDGNDEGGDKASDGAVRLVRDAN